jgi:hypothetical protein
MIDPKVFAASSLALLQADPRRYRNYGAHWWFVKRLLKRFYDRNNLALLGDYEPPGVEDLTPKYEDVQEALAGAITDYRQNASFNLGRNTVTDQYDQKFTLVDTDALGL